MLRRATRVIVLGESLKKLFDGLVKESHIFVVPNGIEWKRPEQPVEKTGNTALYRILHLSTLSHLKGALVLLQAIPLILCRHQNVQFVFAGPWSHLEDKQWAEEFIRREGIACFVEFTGQVEDGHKRKLFESSHMFIFPGLQQEGQPLVVLEAMAASLPILFTDRGCLKETVEDGTSGLCVRTNDPQDLANHIVSMLEHPQRMYEMGRAARKRYEERFTKEQHIAAMLQVFQSAIAAVK
jgi:glycosyltransferase involved in cell wall biosynthesis